MNKTLTEQDTKSKLESLFRGYSTKKSITIPDSEIKEGDRLVSLSDLQIPFEDDALLIAVERFIKDWKPKWEVFNGDILDFYEASNFDKNPGRRFFLDDELKIGKGLIERHQKLVPGIKQLWVDGNHEDRIFRMLANLALGSESLFKSHVEILGLDKLRGYVPYGRYVEFLGFVFTHGSHTRGHSSYSARAHYEDFNSSGSHGHTHRLGQYSRTDHKGIPHTFYEQGCLCVTDLEYVKGVPNWQQGFLIGTVAGGVLHTQLIHVLPDSKGGRGFFAGGNYYKV